MPPPFPAPPAPLQPLHHLDILWVQVAGTLCNLECTHCFVSCGPTEGRHAMMSRESVRERLAEGLALGVKEVYFTGGEPFLHRDLLAILEDTLAFAPATVLTNGTLFTERRVAGLAALARTARFSLELRVSLDGADAATHDTLRGAGSFRRTLDGLRATAAAGLAPIVTATQAPGDDPLELRERYALLLRHAGIAEPRIKLVPLFRLGRETERSGAPGPDEGLALLPEEAFDPHRLQCGSCRAVTSNGVYVCPLLVDEPAGRMGDTLLEASRPFTLAHSACATCWATGMSCANG